MSQAIGPINQRGSAEDLSRRWAKARRIYVFIHLCVYLFIDACIVLCTPPPMLKPGSQAKLRHVGRHCGDVPIVAQNYACHCGAATSCFALRECRAIVCLLFCVSLRCRYNRAHYGIYIAQMPCASIRTFSPISKPRQQTRTVY